MRLITTGIAIALLVGAWAHDSEAQERMQVEARVLADVPSAQVVTAAVALGEYEQDGALLDRPARLTVQDLVLQDALRELHEASGIPLIFSPSLLPEVVVTCHCAEAALGDVLDRLLHDAGLDYVVNADQVVIIRRPVRPPSTIELPAHLLDPVAGIPSFSPRIESSLTSPPAQGVGVVTGRVEDASTGQPLASVQVYVAGLDMGTLSQQNGRYLLQDVPAGTHTLTVERIGYRTQTQDVTLGDDETVVQDFQLTEEALQLDALVVTGTAGATQRRAVGNAVSQISADEIVDMGAVGSVGNLLSGRASGVTVQQGAGGVGMGSRIRLRGQSSLLLGQEPIVYVDGIRVDNRVQGRQSRIDDVNPEDIESIEVVKGPAAATLYGTEASSGVIQIITKRGSEGAPQFNVRMQQGAMWIPSPEQIVPTNYWVNDGALESYDVGEVVEFNLYESESARGHDPFRTGRTESYGLDVRGGSSTFQYFFSGDFDRSTGIAFENDQERWNLRSNLSVIPTGDLTLNASIGFTRSNTSSGTSNDTGPFGFFAALARGRPWLSEGPSRGWQGPTPEVMEAAFDEFQDLTKVSMSVQVSHQLSDWLDHRLTVGTDVVDIRSVDRTNLLSDPVALSMLFGSQRPGEMTAGFNSLSTTTIDYGASASVDLNDAFASRSSVGLQYFNRQSESVVASGDAFPGPGLETVSATASRTGDQGFTENTTLGMYLQQEIHWRDRLFFTAAIRADDNSAFGEDFTFVTYPKVSASWVVSEEPFFDIGWWSDLRLRAAFGASGRAPGNFDALRTFEPVTGREGDPAVTPDQAGNPDLAPERGTELEIGFEAGLFDDRLGIEFTYYDQTTEDVILSRQNAPSGGFPGSTLVNAGELESSGIEFAMTGTPLQNLSLGLNLSLNSSKITDLADIPFLRRAGHISSPWDVEGYQPGSYFARTFVAAEFDEDGNTVNLLCDGGAGAHGRDHGGSAVDCDEAPSLHQGNVMPDWEGSFSLDWQPLEGVLVHGLLDWQMGRKKFLQHDWTRCTNYRVCRENVFPMEYDPIHVAYVQHGGNQDLMAGWFVDASFVKFRELSVTYRLPETWLSSLRDASITVSGRHLHTWSDWPEADPETISNIGSGGTEYDIGAHPIPTQLVTTLRIGL